ncbi:MAG: sensor histidine kinase KdpD [Bdellovibrionales bacterium]|nr:sensor histidine kinase KdpD [Bdellovibrionales bacterium]
MGTDDKRRPNPDDLLKGVQDIEKRSIRGSLRVFFGMCPGVGKTFSMLRAAQDRLKEGVDVVVGVVETHDRVETANVLAGLEIVPRRQLEYKSTLLEEMDLDAILKRRPNLVLVDELAHTNAPGSRHAKRYQDVQELLVAGIDVYTTLNVQHIESRSDLVMQITGVPVQEKIPDSFLDLADQIELIDLSPEVLLQRLRDGKVYLGDRAARAADGFFKIENVIALRELALRFTAEKVDSQLRSQMLLKQVPGVWNTNERLLVAVSFSPYSARLIRATRRMAYNLEAPWIALYVDTGEILSEDDQKQLKKNLTLAKELGAEVVHTVESSIIDAVKRTALEKNVTQIVIGRPDKRFIRDFLTQGTILDQLVRETSEIDIHVIRQERKPKFKKFSLPIPSFQSDFIPYWYTFIFIITVGVFSYAVAPWIGYRAVGFIFLSAILVVSTASLFGVAASFGPLLFAAGFCALIWNYFFIPPQFTFQIKEPEDVMNVLVFFVAAFVAGYLVSRIKKQEAALSERAHRASVLYEFSKSLGSAKSRDDIAGIARDSFLRIFGFEIEMLLKTNGNELSQKPEGKEINRIDPKELAVAAWSFQNSRPAGWGTETLSASKCMSVPLKGRTEIIGVIIIWPRESVRLDPELESLMEIFISNTAVAFEREIFEQKSKDAEVLATSEKLHQALLSSVSHELKTPLTAIIGNATALKQEGEALSAADKNQVLGDLIDSTERLNRVVENLLDMTRISSGALKVREDIFELGDFVDSCLSRFASIFKNHRVSVNRLAHEVLVKGDEKLLEHVFINLISNAVKYSPTGTDIIVEVGGNGSDGSVSVLDQGPGIPALEKDKVFERFYRIPGSPTGGTGLGLSIAKALIVAMGGEISVENRLDRSGALFTFTLKQAKLSFQKGET